MIFSLGELEESTEEEVNYRILLRIQACEDHDEM